MAGTVRAVRASNGARDWAREVSGQADHLQRSGDRGRVRRRSARRAPMSEISIGAQNNYLTPIGGAPGAAPRSTSPRASAPAVPRSRRPSSVSARKRRVGRLARRARRGGACPCTCVSVCVCRVRGAPPLFLSSWCVGRAVCAAALGCLSCASGGFCLSVRVVGSWGGRDGVFVRTLFASGGASA